jgi:hypothetical protein
MRRAFRVHWLFLVVTGPVAAAPPPPLVVAWQGYSLEAPAGYCVESRRGPDFITRYLRLGGSKGPVLVGVYTGHAPSFQPECAQPTQRAWTRNGLSFQSVRGADRCAEFLVSDPNNGDRGFLHLWFGPDAKDHSELAERLVDSIRPAPKDARSSEPAACN